MQHTTREQKKMLAEAMTLAVSTNIDGETPFGQPYIAPVLYSLYPVAISGDIMPTLAVDKYWRLYINFEFFAGLSEMHRAIVLQHEAWHLLHNHSGLQEDFEMNPQIVNAAGDYQINGPLEEWFPEGDYLLPSKHGYEKNQDFWYYVLKLNDQAKQNKSGNNPSGNSSQPNSGNTPGSQQSGTSQFNDNFNGSGDGNSEHEKIGDHQEDGEQGNGSGFGQSKSDPTCSGGSGSGNQQGEWELDPKDAPAKSKTEQDMQRRRSATEYTKWRKDAENKGRGIGSADYDRWVDNVLNGSLVNWKRELGQLTGRLGRLAGAGPKPIYSRPNRRRGLKGQLGSKELPNRKVFTPATRKVLPKIAVAVDTSGSMGEDDLQQACNEISAIVKQVGPVEYFSVDSEVVRGDVEHYKGRGQLKLAGGGGTDMTAAIKFADELGKEVLVIITDGDTPWECPPPSKTQVIACIVGTDSRYLRELTERVPSWINALPVLLQS